MNTPKELLYSKSHEWVAFSGDTAKVGLTDFAQNALGGLVFVNLPEVGDEAVSDVYCPVSGEVTAINEDLLDQPELINQSPYEAWLFEVGSISDKEELLDAAAYEAFCAEEE